MDIRKHAVAQTSRLHLLSATDEPLYSEDEHGNPDLSKPIAVNLYGPGSKQYARAQQISTNRNVEKLRRRGKADQTAEQRRKETAEFLSMCTASWENMSYDDLTGNELSMAVYSDIQIGFIAEQVNKYLGDWGNFSKASPNSSSSTSDKTPG
jgi:hypothetical protein